MHFWRDYDRFITYRCGKQPARKHCFRENALICWPGPGWAGPGHGFDSQKVGVPDSEMSERKSPGTRLLSPVSYVPWRGPTRAARAFQNMASRIWSPYSPFKGVPC